MSGGLHGRSAVGMATCVSALALSLAVTWPAHGQVDLPVPVPLPEVELPPVALPAPVPPPVIDPPSMPPVAPAAPQVTAPELSAPEPSATEPRASAPSAAPGTRSVGVAVSAVGVPGPFGSGGASPFEEGGERGSRGIHGTHYRKRGRLVRELRGCLDRLPRMQRSALIVRYGIGRIESRSPRLAARALGLSRSRFRRLERRGVRALVAASRRSSCERTGVARATFAAIFWLLLDRSAGGVVTMPAVVLEPAGGGVRAASAQVPGAGGAGAVRGARESGAAQGRRRDSGQVDRGTSGTAPSLTTPFGDLRATPGSPLFVLLLAVVLAGAGLAARSILRALR
jgi:hypothetical protein